MEESVKSVEAALEQAVNTPESVEDISEEERYIWRRRYIWKKKLVEIKESL